MLIPLDVQFLGRPQVIAACLLEGPHGSVALVDPGPTTSLPGLRAALAAKSWNVSFTNSQAKHLPLLPMRSLAHCERAEAVTHFRRLLRLPRVGRGVGAAGSSR